METQLVIFLAFTSAILSANTLAVWLAYKAFDNAASSVTTSLHELRANGEARAFLESLEVASSQAAAMTSFAKQQLEDLDPVFAHVQEAYGYGLARVDNRLESACATITDVVESAQDAILRPATRVGMVAARIQSVAKMASNGNGTGRGKISRTLDHAPARWE